jgi:hypothetical protein
MCHVSWADGPTVALVNTVAQRFSGEGFDGMTDSAYPIRALLPDGRHSLLRLVLTQRTLTAAFVRRIVAQVANFFGVPAPDVSETPSGSYVVEGGNLPVEANTPWGLDWYGAIQRAAGDATRFQRTLS